MRLIFTVWFSAIALAQIPPTFSIKVEPPAASAGRSNSITSPVPCPRSMSVAGIELVNDRLMLIGVNGCSANYGSFLVRVSPTGINHLASFPAAGIVDLPPTVDGKLIVRVVQRTGSLLQEFASDGTELSRRLEPLPNARKQVFLESGVMRQFPNASISLTNGLMAKPVSLVTSVDSLFLPLSGQRVLAVDQELAALQVYDTARNAFAGAQIQSPDVARGVAKYREIAQNAPAGQPAPRGLVVIDAKARNDRLYALITPYSRDQGALLIETSLSGSVVRQWRFHFDSVDRSNGPRFVAVSDQTACLASTTGYVGCFPMK